MKISRLSLIPISTLFVLGCSSLGKTRFQDASMISTEKALNGHFGTVISRDFPLQGSKPRQFFLPMKNLKNEPHETVCRNGKQIRKLKNSIIYVMPKIQKGIPIDTANKLKSDILRVGIAVAEDLFNNISQHLSVSDNAIHMPFKDDAGFYFLPSNKSGDLVKTAKSSSVGIIEVEPGTDLNYGNMHNISDLHSLVIPPALRMNYDEEALTEKESKIVELNKSAFVLVTLDKTGPMYLVHSSVLKFAQIISPLSINGFHFYRNHSEFGQVRLSDSKPIIEIQNTIQNPNILSQASHLKLEQVMIKKTDNGEEWANSDSLLTLNTLFFAHDDLLNSLRNGYTFLIPKEVQDKIIQEKTQCNQSIERAQKLSDIMGFSGGVPFKISQQCFNTRNYIGLDDNGHPSISLSLEKQNDFWQLILSKYTSIKSAPDPTDPLIIHFDVELDLSLLCKYGRPVKDLVSQ